MATQLPGPAQLAARTEARIPRLLFGPGRSSELIGVIRSFGRRALIVVREGFEGSAEWARLSARLDEAGVRLTTVSVEGEPSPDLVDEIVREVRAGRTAEAGPAVDVVVGIGGGSVLDTAKAVAGLLIPGNSVRDHLEGVGPQLTYRGPAVPFVALPTTAGTGSEATRNAVLSVRGAGGFKKSFRDETLVARVAIVDPDLLASCPPSLIAANGMDAVTQLLESYTSLRANPFTDEVALVGLAAARVGLVSWYSEAAAGRGGEGLGSVAAVAREQMAYAAVSSGIALAQAGLGAVHGLASPLGAQFPIPHGVACGAVLRATTEANIAAMTSREPANPALARYASAGRTLAGLPTLDDEAARGALVGLFREWETALAVPVLSAYGIGESDIPAILADARGSSMKTNPIVLTDDELATILRESL